MGDWLDLGGAEVCVVSGGRFKLDGGGMFGIIPRPLWERFNPPDDRNRVDLETNCLVIRTGEATIVVDTGNGSKMSDKDRSIFALDPGACVRMSLGQVGIPAQSVTHVILSHLHMDHAGGASELAPDGSIQLSFPRAVVVTQRGEWKDAVANRSTMRASYRPENLVPLEASGHLSLMDGDGVVVPGVCVVVTPGHTPHLTTVHVKGSHGYLVYAADVIPTWTHLRLPYNAAYDQEPFRNMQAKRRLLEECCAGDWLMVTAHDPHIPVGRVKADGPDQWVVTSIK